MRITSKGQVTIPLDIRRQCGLLPHTEVIFRVEEGRVLLENVYRLTVMNTTETRQRYTVQASGLAGLAVGSETTFELEPASVRSVPLRLQVPADEVPPGSHKVTIEVSSRNDAAIHVREHTTFLGLRP
jgi:AbrB family looped-hinge helix DNA binding protein